MLMTHVHSTASVVTSSSTELFCGSTDKTEEQIWEMIHHLERSINVGLEPGDDGWTPHGVGEVLVGDGPDALREFLVEYLHMGWVGEDNLNIILRRFLPYDSGLELPDREEMPTKPPLSVPLDTWEERRVKLDEYEEQMTMFIEDWFNDNADVLDGFINQVVVVVGEGDNSIPYELFEILQRHLNAHRIHMG